MGSTLKERIIAFIEKMGFTKAQFEKNAGLSNGFVDKSGDNSRRSSLDKISKAYPQLNMTWLLTGEGEMLKGAEPQRETEDKRRSEQVSVPYTVPLIPISAQGGSFNDFVVSVRDGDCEKVISPVRHVDFALTVTGDSMAPEYPGGSQVLVRKVDGRAFIEWGRVYVLDTCNGTVIKKLNPGRDDEEVQCVSVNPDYQPFYVKLSDVYGLYRVMMCMTLK